MDHIANNVLTAPIEKNMIFTSFFILINLPLYYVFQAPPSLSDFFQLSSTCHVHLKTGTCSLDHVEQQFQLPHPVGFIESL
jgi:hypothetical protein